jgi:outer membrane cobalamin receptor
LLTKEVIVYSDSLDGSYQNYPKAGSSGIELVYSIRKKNWYANLTYSFSNAIDGDSVVQTYKVPQAKNQYVGFSAHKVTLNSNFSFSKHVSFNPSFIYGGKRYAFTEFDDAGDAVATTMPSYLLVNAFLSFKNVLTPGLSAGLGVYDILNERPAIPQAYQGNYVPIPARSREYVVKLSYQLNFKK